MSKRYRQQSQQKRRPTQRGQSEKPITKEEWERLVEDATLRDAYTQFASEVQLSQRSAEERARLSGQPVENILDLRNAGRVLDQYPQLIRYLDTLRDRASLRESAMTRPDVTLSSPTGGIRGETSGMLGGWVGTGVGRNNPIGVHNVRQLRDWSDHDEWVSAAKAFLCGKVSRADIAVLPLDERKPYNRAALKSLQVLLDQPNEMRDEWPFLIYMFVNDYLTLGQGAITKSMTLRGRKPMALYVEDAANIKIYPAWSGDPNEPRYLFEQGSYGLQSNKKPLRNDECILAFCNPASYRFGLGPVQVLADTIEADLRATATALRMVEQKPPGNVVSLPGWTQQAISKLRSDYETELAGRREILFLGGANAAQVFPLVFSPKDSQFLEYQEYLVRKICAVFQVSPIDLNLTQDVNRATAQAQREISDSKGFVPLLLTLETYFNNELVADFAPSLPYGRFDLDALNLRVVFPEVSEAARMMHAEKMIELATEGLAGLPSFTLNQILMLRGEETVPGGNAFYVLTSAGPALWLSYEGKDGMQEDGSLASGGAVGSQDAAGGPPASDDSSDDDMTGGGDGGAGGGAHDASTSGGASGEGIGGDMGSADTGANTAEKRYGRYNEHRSDTRRPGKSWSPSVMKTATRDVEGKRPIPPHLAHMTHRTHAEVEAEAVLQAAVRRVFEDAQARGGEALRGGAS